ncbi:MAG TPA: bifunctional nuclease family protein [Acidimicrobiales bacterium]|nr:bifunctional nuclease family protein [Acidimicrobiales bacterium]
MTDHVNAEIGPDENTKGGESPPHFLPLSFVEVRIDLPAQFPIVILREYDSPHRIITIPVGFAEGTAIAHAAQLTQTPRPLTHELTINVLEAFGIEVVTLRITDLVSGNFVGEIVLSGPDGQRILPCRVSDGIALCLRQRPPVPITASPSVIDQTGIPA